jgi:hypothetical protein
MNKNNDDLPSFIPRENAGVTGSWWRYYRIKILHDDGTIEQRTVRKKGYTRRGCMRLVLDDCVELGFEPMSIKQVGFEIPDNKVLRRRMFNDREANYIRKRARATPVHVVGEQNYDDKLAGWWNEYRDRKHIRDSQGNRMSGKEDESQEYRKIYVTDGVDLVAVYDSLEDKEL